jgi:hypothetical protein
MGSAAKIRAIYAELRRAIGDAATAGELLRLAHAILKSFAPDLDELGPFGRPREGRAFFAIPLDEAMGDGGWKILNFEAHRNFDIEDLDPQDFPPLQVEIQQFLGAQWRPTFRNESDPPKPKPKVENGKHESGDRDGEEEPEPSGEGPSPPGESADAAGGSDPLWRLEPARVGLRDEEGPDTRGETGHPICDGDGAGQQVRSTEAAAESSYPRDHADGVLG